MERKHHSRKNTRRMAHSKPRHTRKTNPDKRMVAKGIIEVGGPIPAGGFLLGF